MIIKIKTTFKRFSDKDLINVGFRIAESLKGNPVFPDPTPAQAVLEKACQDLQLALSVAGRSDRTKISAKNDAKAVLRNLIAELAEYITNVSQGDRTKLLSSGFDITGQKNGGQGLPAISALEVEIGPPGQAITRVKKVRGARSYIHQYTADPITSDSVWISETVTDHRCTINNLQSVSRYWFRVIAVGPNKQAVYSPLVSRVIQ